MADKIIPDLHQSPEAHKMEVSTGGQWHMIYYFVCGLEDNCRFYREMRDNLRRHGITNPLRLARMNSLHLIEVDDDRSTENETPEYSQNLLARIQKLIDSGNVGPSL